MDLGRLRDNGKELLIVILAAVMSACFYAAGYYNHAP